MPHRRTSLAVTIIGAGRVGSTLALLLHRKGHSIVSVISRTERSAHALARAVRCRVASVRLADVDPHSALVLIAAPESVVGEIAEGIADVRFDSRTSPAIAHTAGALTSDILSPVAAARGRIFSLHPIQTFPPQPGINRLADSMKGVWYGFEGPSAVRPFARSLVKDLGGHFLEVPKERKNLYHVACVFASNYPVVLMAALEKLAKGVGFKGLEPFRILLDSSIRNSYEMGAAGALTGPLVRASLGVVDQHKKALIGRDPELFDLYAALGMYGLSVLLSKGRITEDQAKEMRSVLRRS